MSLLLNHDALNALSIPMLEQLRIALKQLLCMPCLTDADHAAIHDGLAMICSIVQQKLADSPSP
ncbi:MAG: hypothetical protein Rhims3KO_36420 [Hyphomicrobiales bacterium]